MSKMRCIAEGLLVYWCVYHDAEWPSGWTECRARNPNVNGGGGGGGEAVSVGGGSGYRREVGAPVAVTIRRVPR